MNADRLLIFDTTLRDGEQSPGYSMTAEEKLRMGLQLERLGVDVIEAGFPISSEADFASVRLLAERIRGTKIAALARCKQEDILRAWEALEPAASPRIHTFLSTSDIHLSAKLKMTRDEALRRARESVAFARTLCPDVEFSPEDATRSDVPYLCAVLEAVIEAGATTVNVPDTVGYATPGDFAALIRTVRMNVRGIEKAVISVHCHDDLGLAVANSLAAVEAGARQVECAINGIGERAGNAALEEVVMATRVRADRLAFHTAVVSEQLYASSQMLAQITGNPVQPNKAVVGRNAFAHEAGIHQHGMLNNPLCYEIMTPESIGSPGTQLVLGKHSGRHALASRYVALGHPLSASRLDQIYRRFTQLADRKKHIYDQDLLSLIETEDQTHAFAATAVDSE